MCWSSWLEHSKPFQEKPLKVKIQNRKLFPNREPVQGSPNLKNVTSPWSWTVYERDGRCPPSQTSYLYISWTSSSSSSSPHLRRTPATETPTRGNCENWPCSVWGPTVWNFYLSHGMYKQCRYRQVSAYNANLNCLCDKGSWIPPQRLFNLETPNQKHDA